VTRVSALTGPELLRRVTLRGRIAVVAANVAGAVVVFVFLAFVVPPVPNAPNVTVPNLIAFVVFMLVAIPFGSAWTQRLARGSRQWLVEERPPTTQERTATLAFPVRQLVVEASGWGVGAIVFAAINLPYSGLTALQVSVAVLLGGVAACALSYLILERQMRPLFARALATEPPSRSQLPGVATRIVLAWAFGAGTAILAAALVAIQELAGGSASATRLAATMLFLALIAVAGGSATLVMAARSVADPLRSLRDGMARIETGDLDVAVPVNDGSEVGLLQAGFNRMAAGLREREELRDLFGRHVGEDVARHALTRGIELGGEQRDVAVLFVDLVGSTKLAATGEPGRVVDILNAFFSTVVDVVTAHGGWVNKFEGDAALCVFGAPTEHPDPCTAALAAGRELHGGLARGLPEQRTGIGLSSGTVVAGNIGAAERFEYTVIGDPVNEAARLTELAKAAPTRLLASEAIVRCASEEEARRWDLGESVTLRGRGEATRLAAPVVSSGTRGAATGERRE
jgi:adenylate cyclase